jgi:hypothetical protein
MSVSEKKLAEQHKAKSRSDQKRLVHIVVTWLPVAEGDRVPKLL